jgi:putative flippase GtrA
MRDRVRSLLANRVVRFGIVGGTVTIVFMGLNALFGRYLGLSPTLAYLAAYPPALFLHYTLNKLWAFGDSRKTSRRHLVEYLLAVAITFAIQWPCFQLLHAYLHFRGWIAAGGANVLQMAASFALLKWRVFKQTPALEEAVKAEL